MSDLSCRSLDNVQHGILVVDGKRASFKLVRNNSVREAQPNLLSLRTVRCELLGVNRHGRLDSVNFDVAILPCQRPLILQLIGVIAEGLRDRDGSGVGLSLSSAARSDALQDQQQAQEFRTAIEYNHN